LECLGDYKMSLANLSAAQKAFISTQYGDEFLAMPESELIDLLDADYNYLISDESPESAESLEQINMLGSIMSTLMQAAPVQVAASAAQARAKIRLRAKMAVVRRAAREAITKRVAAANPKDVRTATAKARERAVELVAPQRKASIMERLAARREDLIDEQLTGLRERLGARIAQREASAAPQFIKVAGQLFEKVEDLAPTVVVGAVKSNEELAAEASTEAPKFIKVAGKLFEKVGPAKTKTAAPELPPEYNIPVTAADLDPEVVSWFHSSQGDPIYALGSRLVAYGETLASQDELSALEYTLGKWLADPANANEDPATLDRVMEVQQAAQALMPTDDAQAPEFIKVNGQVYELDAVRTAELKAKEAPKFIKVAGKLFEREG
jgi:hypothetical protein